MKTFCFNCSHEEDVRIVSEEEFLDFRDVKVHVQQKHAFCCSCGAEVFPDCVVNENVSVANDAYREALGIITVSEMRIILERYDIGARPLSLLLGWGENTIERQMKHTMPDLDHSNRLKALMDPYNMADLLIKFGSRITPVALAKLASATLNIIRDVTSGATMQNEKGNVEFYQIEEPAVKTISVSADEKEDANSGFMVSYHNSNKSSFSYTNPFDYPDAA